MAALSTTALTLFTAWFMRERSDYLARGAHSPRRALRDVWRNKRARLLLLVFVVQQLGVTCVILVAPFFIDYVLQAPGHIATVILVFMLSGTFSIPVWMIRFLYAGVPLVLWTVGILMFLRFKLSAAEHGQIRAAIDARASASVE